MDLDAPARLVPGAARAEVRALDELVLELPDVRVLRLELHLIAGTGRHRVDRLAGLVERVLLGTPPELEDARERARDLGRRVAPRDVDRDPARFGIAQARGLAAVVVLQRNDDIGVLGLAHDRDRQVEPARSLIEPRPRDPEWVDLHGLANVS